MLNNQVCVYLRLFLRVTCSEETQKLWRQLGNVVIID